MRKKQVFKNILLSVALGIGTLTYAFSQEPEQGRLADGTYQAANDKIEVAVTVIDGKLIDIDVVRHNAPEKYKNLIRPLIESMIMQQTSAVDGITGATASSDALKSVVGEALKESREAAQKEENREEEL